MVSYATAPTGVMQPWNGVVFPSAGSNWEIAAGMTSQRARAIPGFGRALDLLVGLAMQMPLDDVRVRDEVVLDRPRLLDQPDPDVSRAWFVARQIEDYLVHGNAITYVTSRDSFTGYPLTMTWVPAEWVEVTRRPAQPIFDELTGRNIGTPERTEWWVGGVQLRSVDVIHVRRGADPWAPWRGVGILEQYLNTLGRVASQEKYEDNVLNGAAVPSVAIITDNPDLSQDEADQAKAGWVSKYGGPVREPAILPAGTTVVPLAWSPHDTQLQEARKASLQDVANMFNMDGYWTGAPAGSFTYRSPGPMYLNLVRQSLAPTLELFEGEWSARFLPRGRRVRFDRRPVLQDDLQTMTGTVSTLKREGLITLSEARQMLGFGGAVPDELNVPAPAPAPAGAPLIPTEPTLVPITDGTPADDQEDSPA